MLCAMAIDSVALRKSVAGIEAGRPFNQNPSSSPTRFHLKLKFPLLSQTKSTKLPIEFHSNPLHTLNILPFARLSCSVSLLFRWDSWRWAAQFTSYYLFFLCLVAQAHGYPSFSNRYPCEDVNLYYANVAKLKGEPLKRKLNSIVAAHHSLSYKEVWDAIKILDAADVDKPEASSAIVEIYSQRIVSKSLAGKPEGWNREHLWPRSYGLRRGPSLTDLHNIHPADTNVNLSRGNKYFGECQVNSPECLKPAYKEAASDTETDKEKWAPPKRVRGDIARAVMYMAVCYGFHLSDSPNKGNKEMGLVSTLLKWNEGDPPSREEKLRNDRICEFYQHNRNPFVDHPEYAELIWKQMSLARESSKFLKGKQ
ncbi:extracellular ribonuclease-like isoform X2 [Benincasa hispida]|uniref:extracellular ribonuclease-like isoform X2 n=1 Tax=Benincasa hispida TaxID=102211 RepID=UPI0019013BE5|nr:extracellular ribonuclease-like isoform X2 [Benincasa hispida]